MTLPELFIADWRATKDTLHLFAQIVGKVRLATAPPRNHGPPSGITSEVLVNREAYTHEVFLVGFNTDNPWTGHDASFYAFMVPEPKGYREAEIAGGEQTPVGIGMLDWERVRAAPDPRALLLEYLQSAYEAAMRCAGLDPDDFASAWHPGER